MKIDSVTIKGFRCFGEETTIQLSESITALVGTNGSGKTALLEALSRVFGVTREQRTVQRDDFYVSPDADPNDEQTKDLSIDIRIVFPEIDGGASNGHLPPFFEHYVVDNPGEIPFIRARLEARWENNDHLDGDIQQNLFWVTTDSKTPGESDKTRCESRNRSLIQVHYIPAARIPSLQLKYATSTMAGRLLRAVRWSDGKKEDILAASDSIRKLFFAEQGIKSINTSLLNHWSSLHKDVIDAEPEFNLVSRNFDEIVRNIGVVFRPTETGGERNLDALSDGQKSLFYFSLTSAVFEIERTIANTAHTNGTENAVEEDKIQSALGEGFQHNHDFVIPVLTVFALEEPENHLSPYYLSRIIGQIRNLTETQSAQAVLTSHSVAILSRIDPVEVRHLRLNTVNRTSIVNAIQLPDYPDQLAKYLQGAVRAYPELYFSRFVILGEGDSEQIVLPRLAAALDFEIDKSFVAMVPLGGRHVNHFWTLLNQLDIPHATLLDLDLGREGAGWQRIKYVCRQLLAINISEERLFKIEGNEGKSFSIALEDLEQIESLEETQRGSLDLWIRHLEKFGVFFSSPLDLDMLLLEAFPSAYQSVSDNGSGPRIPSSDSQRYETYIDAAAKAVVGDNYRQAGYSQEALGLLPWYRYLFLNKSKPATHLQALTSISDEDLRSQAPEVLQRLLKFCRDNVEP
ncbi:MAG: AAA family ATPase [Cyanobacteria bacterium P01_A01_bin.17]